MQTSQVGTTGMPMPGMTPTTTVPTSTHEEKKLQRQVNEEYHDPYDDWSSRDILLSLVPFIVTYAFKDIALRHSLAFAITWTGFLLIMRTIAYDSRRKTVWPLIELIGILAFPILLGMTYVNYYQMIKWWNVIIPAILGFSILLSLVWRRPFTAHYARYPKFDRGGSGVWHGDALFRRASDMNSLNWFFVFFAMTFLALIAVLTGNWGGWHSLNIIFQYIVPGLLLWYGLIAHQLLGTWYRGKTTHDTMPHHHHHHTGYTSYPAGATEAMGTGATTPATYSTNV